MRLLYITLLILCCFSFNPNIGLCQDCSNPVALCQGVNSEMVSTAEGLPTPVPGDYCFQTENAVYYSFETLDNITYPSVDFSNPTATLNLSGLSCNTDTVLGQAINLAIFTAADPCNESTYDNAIVCETNIATDTTIQLTGLQPATTYYLLISGTLDEAPAESPAECTLQVEVSGPAVTYNLQADPFEQFVFQGQQANFSVNPAFEPYEWEGENLTSTTGFENSATPQEPNKEYWYSASTTIEGCEYKADFLVNVRTAILVYNVMTPNGDGINDFFEIERNAIWPDAQIWIYNRWGQKVFQTIHYQNNWDGGGLPAGVYYYVIDLNDQNLEEPTYTGSITIIR